MAHSHDHCDAQRPDRLTGIEGSLGPVAVVVVAQGEAVLPLPVGAPRAALEARREGVGVEGGAPADRDVLPSD